MKRRFAALALVLVVLLTACGTPGVYMLGDLIPELIDSATQYPEVEKVAVTDCATGDIVEFTDAKIHDNIRMQLEQIRCTRSKIKADAIYSPVYEVVFYTVGGDACTVTILSETAYLIGEYRYDAVSIGVDLVYFGSLFEE